MNTNQAQLKDPRQQKLIKNLFIASAVLLALITYQFIPHQNHQTQIQTQPIHIPSINQWSTVHIHYLNQVPTVLDLKDATHPQVSIHSNKKFEIDPFIWTQLSKSLHNPQTSFEARSISTKELKHFGLHEQAIRLEIAFKDHTLPILQMWIGQEHVKQYTWVRFTSDQDKKALKIYRITGTWRRWFEKSLKDWQNRRVFSGKKHTVTCISLYPGEYQSHLKDKNCTTQNMSSLMSPHRWVLQKDSSHIWKVQKHPKVTLDQNRVKSQAFNLASSHIDEILDTKALPKPWKATHTFEWTTEDGQHAWFSMMPVPYQDLQKRNQVNYYIKYHAGYGILLSHIQHFIKTNVHSLLTRKLYASSTKNIRQVYWEPASPLQNEFPIAWKAYYQNTIWLLSQTNQNHTSMSMVDFQVLKNWLMLLEQEGAGSHIQSWIFERFRKTTQLDRHPKRLGRLHIMTTDNNDWIDVWKLPYRTTYLFQRSWDDLLINVTAQHTQQMMTGLMNHLTPLTPQTSP